MSTLIMMIGIPGCGKSTYAKKMVESNQNMVHISRDDVRYEFVSDQEHYFDHENEVYREFCNRIDMHLLRGETVIADATHLSSGSRKKLLNQLQVTPDKIIAVVINTPFEVCMERNAAREGITRVPDKTMFQMRSNFRPPSPNEGFDKIVFVK